MIVTGTSKGLGEAVAWQLLQRGDIVCGIARGSSPRLSVYRHYYEIAADLSDTGALDRLMADCMHLLRESGGDCEMLGLINNAASVEPLGSLGACMPEDIDRAMRINLVAPAVLASSFLRRSAGWICRRKVINISSGCARYPNPDMSVYSASKAGLEMLTRCAGAEQEAPGEAGVEFLAVDPGMMDTGLQRQARETAMEKFSMAGYFTNAYTEGWLHAPDAAAAAILELLDKRLRSGSVITELIAQGGMSSP